jgi:hypothetical protein
VKASGGVSMAIQDKGLKVVMTMQQIQDGRQWLTMTMVFRSRFCPAASMEASVRL